MTGEQFAEYGGTRVTTIRLPADLLDTLDMVVRVDGHTRSAHIVAAVQRYVNERTVTTEFRAAAAGLLARDRARLAALEQHNSPGVGDDG